MPRSASSPPRVARSVAMCAALALAACGGAVPSTAPIAPAPTEGLARQSLAGSSLAELQLLTSEQGRDLLARVVACALPPGVKLTAIGRDGTPYAFPGAAGLAPAWADRPATAIEHRQVRACLLGHA
jgi:hypothetical protein